MMGEKRGENSRFVQQKKKTTGMISRGEEATSDKNAGGGGGVDLCSWLTETIMSRGGEARPDEMLSWLVRGEPVFGAR